VRVFDGYVKEMNVDVRREISEREKVNEITPTVNIGFVYVIMCVVSVFC
jgi:hypothetical protein